MDKIYPTYGRKIEREEKVKVGWMDDEIDQ